MRQLENFECNERARGFTLIEILIVLFIISIVTGAALLSISQNENKQIESFTNELTQLLVLAEEQAILEPNVLGLSFSEHSFQFYRLQPQQRQTKMHWLPLDDRELSRRTIPKSIQVNLQFAGNQAKKSLQDEDEDQEEASDNKDHPQIIISTNGDLTPFVIYVGKKGQQPRYAISGEADGNLTSKPLS